MESLHKKTDNIGERKVQISCAVTAQMMTASLFSPHRNYNPSSSQIINEFSSFQSSSVAVQARFCQTWLETQTVGFSQVVDHFYFLTMHIKQEIKNQIEYPTSPGSVVTAFTA